MKGFFIFGIGIAVGAVGTLAVLNPREVAQVSRQVTTRVEEFSREKCVKDYLAATHCYQKQPAVECDARIVRECGTPDKAK